MLHPQQRCCWGGVGSVVLPYNQDYQSYLNYSLVITGHVRADLITRVGSHVCIYIHTQRYVSVYVFFAVKTLMRVL